MQLGNRDSEAQLGPAVSRAVREGRRQIYSAPEVLEATNRYNENDGVSKRVHEPAFGIVICFGSEGYLKLALCQSRKAVIGARKAVIADHCLSYSRGAAVTVSSTDCCKSTPGDSESESANLPTDSEASRGEVMPTPSQFANSESQFKLYQPETRVGEHRASDPAASQCQGLRPSEAAPFRDSESESRSIRHGIVGTSDRARAAVR